MDRSSTISSQWLSSYVRVKIKCRFSVGFFSLSCFCQLSCRLRSFVVFALEQSVQDGRRNKQHHESQRTLTASRQLASSQTHQKCCQNTYHHRLKATRHRNFINGVNRRRCSNTSRYGRWTQAPVQDRHRQLFITYPISLKIQMPIRLDHYHRSTSNDPSARLRISTNFTAKWTSARNSAIEWPTTKLQSSPSADQSLRTFHSSRAADRKATTQWSSTTKEQLYKKQPKLQWSPNLNCLDVN